MKPYGIIYKATNNMDCKSYVGYTTKLLDKRIKGHWNDRLSSRDFSKALLLHGLNSFTWGVLKECDDILMLKLMETFMIMVHHTHMSEGGYNMTWGGDGSARRQPGWHHTDETKKKMSLSWQNRPPMSEETKQKMRIANKGRKRTEEFKKSCSERITGMNNPMYGKRNPMEGKHHTDETKRKIGEKSKGRKHTKETIAKILLSRNVHFIDYTKPGRWKTRPGFIPTVD